MTWLTIGALCGSYHDVLAKEQVFIPTYVATVVGSRGKESPRDAYFLPRDTREHRPALRQLSCNLGTSDQVLLE